MKYIEEYVHQIDEEIEGAKCYAEAYLMYKSKGSNRASQYKNMAQDELNHAMALHGFVTEEIEELSKTYTPPVEMTERWEKSHKRYVECAAWVKTMLQM